MKREEMRVVLIKGVERELNAHWMNLANPSWGEPVVMRLTNHTIRHGDFSFKTCEDRVMIRIRIGMRIRMTDQHFSNQVRPAASVTHRSGALTYLYMHACCR